MGASQPRSSSTKKSLRRPRVSPWAKFAPIFAWNFAKSSRAATAKLGVELRELIAGLRTEFARLETEVARRLTVLETEAAGLRLRGAYRSDQDYDRLDVVTLDGSSYIARQGSPGPCPGDGW